MKENSVQNMASWKTRRTRWVLRVFLLIATVISLSYVPWNHLWAWLAPLPDTVQEQADDAVGRGLDGIIVYVDQAGKEPAFYAAGWKNRETRVPADPRALFKIASINKLYVAVAAARLAHRQELSLDESLADHFPELVGRIENAETITLRLMLKHRSGIPNFIDHPDYPWHDLPKSSGEALEFALDQPADFKPGEDYGYSNTNYLLIAELLDKVTPHGLYPFIRDEILVPLELNNTFNSLQEVDMDDLMSGYFVGWKPDLKSSNHGSMIATAEDVGIFLRALNDGSLLSEEEQAIYSSVYVYEHTGSVPGYSSIARYHQDIDTVVIQFVNTSGGISWSMTEIVYSRILKILLKQY
jgi:CubicO group peptidase (beta-lactamase class C family)